METGRPRLFASLFWLACGLIFLLVALRCALVPFAHDEVATFHYYIQPGSFWPFYAHPDANGHFLTSTLGWISYKLFGSSPFSLRLPSLLSFIVLCYALWRMREFFRTPYAWLLLVSGILLSFNFLGFYALCRGYGLSMSFLLLALFYFFLYAQHIQFRHFLKFILFSQAALSANLTLLPVTGLITLLMVVRAFRGGALFRAWPLAVLAVHAGLFVYWALYGMFLKEHGALYYGAGESYWKVTFESLIGTIASAHPVIQFIAVFGAVLLLGHVINVWRKDGLRAAMGTRSVICFAIFWALVAGFYLMKVIGGVNYPEDRTALFFYVVYIMGIAFMADESNRILRVDLAVIPFYFIAHFVANCNLSVHPWRIYETIPAKFIERLKVEQESAGRKVTIGGHRVYEFFYGFLNFRSGGTLNHCTAPETLDLNCDYAIAKKSDSIGYSGIYNELETDAYWGFRLIGRKSPLLRGKFYENNAAMSFTGPNEYYNAIELRDTILGSGLPVLAEIDFSVNKAPCPFNTWLVLQVDTAENAGPAVFVRTPLSLVKEDWEGVSRHTLGLMSGVMPTKIKRLVVYLWNIDRKEINLTLHATRLFHVNGEGVKTSLKVKS